MTEPPVVLTPEAAAAVARWEAEIRATVNDILRASRSADEAEMLWYKWTEEMGLQASVDSLGVRIRRAYSTVHRP